MMHRARSVAAVVLSAVLLGAVITGSTRITSVNAAPNPYIGGHSEHLVTIAENGSYEVHIDQTVELARTYGVTFGGRIHNGFRLPDTSAVIPPYLRAEYSDPRLSMDGATTEVEVERIMHSVEISGTGEFVEGEHRAAIDYTVSGAAVKAGGGYLAHFTPLNAGDVTVTAADRITGVECEAWPQEARSCGSRTGESWTIGVEELELDGAYGSNTIIRVEIAGDASQLIDPIIDSGS